MNEAASQSLSLCEKYRPKTIAEFVGLAEPKRILQRLAVQPSAHALLFEGKTGSGKTAMAVAFAAAIPAQVHLLPAHACTRDHVAMLWMTCQNQPRAEFRMHLILVDQADTLHKSQQFDLRSKIDGCESLKHVIWVFTGTTTEKLDDGFRSRCLPVNFSTYGNSKEAARWIERIWQAEAASATPPNFARIVKEANGSLRAALMEIERKLDLA